MSKPESVPVVSGARVVRNTAINGFASVGGLLITLALTPFLLDELGQDGFGVWVLALTFTVSAGYLTLTDLGLQQAAVRYMADARRQTDTRGLTELYSTTFAVFVGVATLAAVVLLPLAPKLIGVFEIRPDLRQTAEATFQIVAAQVLFDLPVLAPRAVLESNQRFAVIRFLDLLRIAVFGGATVALLLAGHGLVALAWASTAASALVAVLCLLIVRSSEPMAHLRKSAVSRRRLRGLLGFSSSLFALRILSVAYRNMDKAIIGVALSVAAVAQYEVANKVSAAMMLFFGTAASALLPAATLLRTDRGRLRELYLKGTSYSVALLVPLATAVFIFAEPLLVAWVGPENAGAAAMVRLFAVWVALGSVDAMGTNLLIALGRLRIIVLLTVAWVIGNLALSVWLVGPLGPIGVVWGTIISYAPLLVAYAVICIRELEITPDVWLSRTVRANLPGLAVQIPVSILLLKALADAPEAVQVLLGGGVGIGLSVLTYLFVGLERAERLALLETVGQALPGRKPTLAGES